MFTTGQGVRDGRGDNEEHDDESGGVGATGRERRYSHGDGGGEQGHHESGTQKARDVQPVVADVFRGITGSQCQADEQNHLSKEDQGQANGEEGQPSA